MRFLLLLLALLLASCATADIDRSQFSHIVSARTGLYEKGPDQTTPPDAYLESGTRIRIVAPAGDMIRIETTYGKSGWIPATAIEKAPDWQPGTQGTPIY